MNYKFCPLFLFCWVVFSSPTALSQESLNKTVVKDEYKSAPFLISRSPTKLAKYLTSKDSSDAQKALNIYTWITHNIKYDHKALRKGKEKYYTAKKTLWRRKGVCNQYSGLFNTLSQLAGLSTREILGYSKGYGYHEDHSFYEADHSWNGIKLGDDWYLVDVTWGSGTARLKEQKLKAYMTRLFKKPFIKNKLTFVPQPDFQYFMASPEWLIATHLPNDPLWQLVDFPVSLSSYEHKNWVAYEHKPDTAYNKKMNRENYREALDKFEFQSENQYLASEAFNSFVFNPRNYGALSEAFFNNSSNYKYIKTPDFEEGVSLNNQAMEYLNAAISHSKKHQTSIKNISGKTYKIVKDRLKTEINSPLRKRIKISNGRNKLIKKKITQNKGLYERLDEQKNRILEERRRRKFGQLLRKRPARYENQKQIEKNQMKLVEIWDHINRSQNHIKTSLQSLPKLIRKKSRTVEKILLHNEQLNQALLTSKNFIVENPQLSQLSQNWHQIDSIGQLCDLYEKELKTLEDTIKNLHRVVKDHQRLLNSESKSGQELLRFNYHYSKGKIFEGSTFEQFNKVYSWVYVERITQNTLLKQEALVEVPFRSEYHQLLLEQQALLDKNEALANLYTERKLGNILFSRHRSYSHMNKIISSSRKKIKKLRAINLRLKQTIVTKKIKEKRRRS